MQNHQNQGIVAGRNQDHRAAYQELGTKILNLHDELIENELTPLQDFDGKQMQLFLYMYRMGSVEPFPVLVKKGSDDSKLTSNSYRCLLGIKHRLVLPVENFYEKGSNYNGWFIFPLIQGSLRAWIKGQGEKVMFEGNGRKRAMAPAFRTMIIDLWSLIYKMSTKRLYPERINIEDFFIKMLSEGPPRIQMFLTQLRVFREACFTPDEEWNRNWDDIDLLIKQCCQVCNVELSETSQRFCTYARNERTRIHFVENFPDNWSLDEKACYLYHMVSGTPSAMYLMRSKINEDTDLKWPQEGVIEMILKLKCNNLYDEKGEWVSCKYDKEKAYDYIQLFRNHHKHFADLPSNIKMLLGGSCEGLIQRMETWEPNIWIMLYETIGPAGRQVKI